MKRLLAMLLTVVLICSMSLPAFAAQDEKENNVTVKYVSTVEGAYVAPVQNGVASIDADGVSVSVTGAPEGSLTLMVVPVPETEKEAWEWIEESMKGKADPVHTFDIHFLDQYGNRVDADGAVVTLNCPHCQSVPVVCSLDTDGTVHILFGTLQSRSNAVTFTTNGSTYYIMAEELPKHDAEIEDKPGGDVVIDNPNPEDGDAVTITPAPDDGKVVDKVVVKDENGKEIPVKDNGDGTYTYEQPDGDVTIEVTFKDDKYPDSPQTGDNSNLWLWWLLLIVSAFGITVICIEQKKRKSMN
ncbi:MAG: hypothetical protein IJN17_01735 [Clostridia bacterium]|nr:hypothetical protein [Clostridia bacterium]